MLEPFYTSTFYKQGTTNWFSRILHKFSIDNKYYGFPYDNDCDQSSSFSVGLFFQNQQFAFFDFLESYISRHLFQKRTSHYCPHLYRTFYKIALAGFYI
ncbi:MAG: hypothetical protein HQ542_02855 [Bacteroidia bacterium]|nr:hypothetical protein [Bacteroidia bacterium]